MTENKNILVFGAAGFIGTYLIDALSKNGHKIIASDIGALGEKFYADKKISYVPLDITQQSDFKKLAAHDFDVVIHLAALQPANFSSNKHSAKDYIDINVAGTVHILEFCREKNIRKIIYASSHRNTSGLWQKKQPVKEEDGRSIQYDGEYAMFSISESAAQDCVEYYRRQCNMQGIIFRLPPVYGFGPHLEIFKDGKPIKTGFQTFIENAAACKPLEVWGDANVGRDIIYVKDVVSAFIKAINSDKAQGLYNIASNYSLTLREEVETIARVFWGDKSNPVFVEKPEKKHTMDSFVYDNSKAMKELGWKPEFNFEKMLLDYKKEKESNQFSYLVEKRKDMFKGES